MPASAFSAWLVQMFEVAFSRRMCCSRVWSVSTNPRRPSTSVVSPAMRPGHAADVALAGGEEAERRTAEVEPVSERLALAERDVDAEVARRAQDAERHRVDRGDQQRAGALGDRRQRLEVLDAAEEVRLLEKDGGGVVVDRRGQRVGVGRSAAQRHLDELAAEAAGVGRERLAAVRMKAARDDEPRAAGLELREVAGGRDRGRPLVERRVRRPAARSAPRSRSGTRTSPEARPARSPAGRACTESGTPSAG